MNKNIVKDIEQGGDEWLSLRVGKITASNAWKLFDRKKDGSVTAVYEDFVWNLVCERVTKQPTTVYVNDAMRWGSEMEDEARKQYAAFFDVCVDQVAFVHHPKYKNVGCSPDGFITGHRKVMMPPNPEKDSLLEIKCPTTRQFMQVLINKAAQPEHILQVQFQMWVTGINSADLMYFDPRMPGDINQSIFVIDADPDLHKRIEAEVVALEQKVEELLARVRAIYKGASHV